MGAAVISFLGLTLEMDGAIIHTTNQIKQTNEQEK